MHHSDQATEASVEADEAADRPRGPKGRPTTLTGPGRSDREAQGLMN